ncbi:MAG: PqqD family peptide modification chaperone [Ghiorsea sp.]|nr:PqqD family peptide modification chaperone [Ghiorsea sp.]
MAKYKENQSTSEKRQQQVMSAIDAIASANALPFLTTQRISKQSKVSEGVLFRHFSSKEAILSSWVEQRSMQLYGMTSAMPAGKEGLRYFLAALLNHSVLLTFMCCQPVDVVYLRRMMDELRQEVWQMLYSRIYLLADKPENISVEALTDHLFQCIYRAWNSNNPKRKQRKERLMTQLPWEKTATGEAALPAKEVLQRLALNDSGFVFDPVTGLSFTANAVGLYVLRKLQKHDDVDALFAAVEQDFKVSRSQAERDLTDFFSQLRKLIS